MFTASLCSSDYVKATEHMKCIKVKKNLMYEYIKGQTAL